MAYTQRSIFDLTVVHLSILGCHIRDTDSKLSELSVQNVDVGETILQAKPRVWFSLHFRVLSCHGDFKILILEICFLYSWFNFPLQSTTLVIKRMLIKSPGCCKELCVTIASGMEPKRLCEKPEGNIPGGHDGWLRLGLWFRTMYVS